MDGKAVDSVPRLLTRLDDHRVGDSVQLSVLRDGRRRDLTVVLQGGGQ
jgi:S1-C subfamily serine protease